MARDHGEALFERYLDARGYQILGYEPELGTSKRPLTTVITSIGGVGCLLERGRRDWDPLRQGARFVAVADAPIDLVLPWKIPVPLVDGRARQLRRPAGTTRRPARTTPGRGCPEPVRSR